MKLQTIIALCCLCIQLSLAQNTDYTITCPENTFLGTFSCTNIDDVPDPVNMLEAAMAPPYNIQIEGELPINARVTTVDSGPIFFCESDARVVTREIIFVTGQGGFEGGYNELARCSFTIETIPDLTPLDFIAPADYEANCDDPENYPSEVTFTGDDCFTLSQENAFNTDETVVEGNNSIITRTWNTTDICGNISEPQIQIITINCAPTCVPPAVGTINCGN